MKRLLKFLHFSGKERRVFIKVALLLSAIRLALWVLPFGILRRLMEGTADKNPVKQVNDHPDIEIIIRAVKSTSRYIPKATCLTQAIAARYLLSRLGSRAELRIGVNREGKEDFNAHAWLECQGKIIIGDFEGISKYTPLPPLEGKNP